jgi:hypothetical protein
MHLHRPGAAKTQSISFVSDGAVWIWDRIGSIVKQAGIPDSVKIHEVLDGNSTFVATNFSSEATSSG